MRSHARPRRVSAVIALVSLALLVVSCGDDDDGGVAGDATEAAATSAAAATSTAAAETTAAATDSTAAAPATSAADDAAEEVDPVEAADREAEFRFAISYGFNSFDPHKTPSPPGDAQWLRPVYDRLLTLAHGDEGVELAPQLATSWEFAPDGLSIEFELRDDVTFQDGATFDASVVKANMDRAMAPDSTVSSLLANVASVEVVDPTHVVFRLKGPDPGLPWLFANGTVAMMISPNALANPDLASKPVGSGPFRLVSAAKDADVVYERWDDHWDPDAALVQQLTVSTISDGNARFNGARTGEFDCAYLGAPHDFESKSLAEQGFHWEQALSPVSYGLLLNTAMAPTDDVRVRRAISMAINRPEISEQLLNGLQPPAYQPFNNGYLGHDPALDEDVYDPDAARALVAEAGAEGANLTFVTTLTAPQESIGQIAQQALADIGLNVELVPVSPTEAIPSWREGGHHGHVGTIIGQAEPSQTLASTYLGVDNFGEKPAELVAMAQEGLALPVGSSEREAKYQEISAYLVENPIHVPIAQFSTVFLCQPDVVGSKNLLKQDIGKLDYRRVGIAAG